MKIMKHMTIVAIASVGLFSVAIASADASYDNASGQSAQMSHTMQDRGQQDAETKETREATRDIRHQEPKKVELLRQRNKLGQSDAMSVTPAYQPYREERS